MTVNVLRLVRSNLKCLVQLSALNGLPVGGQAARLAVGTAEFIDKYAANLMVEKFQIFAVMRV